MSAVLKSSHNSDTMVHVVDGVITIQSGAQAIQLHQDDGILISGPLGITSAFDRIKFSGMFRFNSLIASTMPSTMISPIPTLEHDLPIKEAASLASIASILLGAI